MAILLKRNTVSGVVPDPTELDIGEVAVNAADARLFTKKTDGTVGEIGTGSVSTTISYIDGGNPDSNYGGIDPIDGGGV